MGNNLNPKQKGKRRLVQHERGELPFNIDDIEHQDTPEVADPAESAVTPPFSTAPVAIKKLSLAAANKVNASSPHSIPIPFTAATTPAAITGSHVYSKSASPIHSGRNYSLWGGNKSGSVSASHTSEDPLADLHAREEPAPAVGSHKHVMQRPKPKRNNAAPPTQATKDVVAPSFKAIFDKSKFLNNKTLLLNILENRKAVIAERGCFSFLKRIFITNTRKEDETKFTAISDAIIDLNYGVKTEDQLTRFVEDLLNNPSITQSRGLFESTLKQELEIFNTSINRKPSYITPSRTDIYNAVFGNKK